VGVVLFGALRDVAAWLDTADEVRGVLFHFDAGHRREEQIRVVHADETLWAPLAVLGELTADPARADSARLLHACRRIAAWAEAHDAPCTRLGFIQAAARLRPHDAALAVEVGRLARDAAEHARAESWFRHAVRIARGADWDSYAWAYIGLGVLYIQTGNHPGAEALLGRALRAARRRRLGATAGAAHHHLFHLATSAGRVLEGYEHARAALDAYGNGHPQLAALVHDVGRYWLHLGEYARAIPLFESVLGVFPTANDRALAASNLARASAGAGLHDQYEAARTMALDSAGRARGTHRLAHAFEILSHADLMVGEWERAERAAAAALELASATGDAEVRVSAEAQVAAARAAQVEPVVHARVEPPAAVRQARLLAEEMVRVLKSGGTTLALASP
jgi:tetratricopeptide (TPR) repeat protein